jgi:DeoR family transcriptional regulator of aga operon
MDYNDVDLDCSSPETIFPSRVIGHMSEARMLAVEREEKILSYLAQYGRGSVPELSHELAVSEATLRRDLRRLSTRYPVRRVYGGAVLESIAGLEAPIFQRCGLHAEEKQRIGRAAAALVSDGETVILVGGSTTLQVVAHLADKRDLTVITDSILIAEKAAEQADTTVILLGGIVRRTELALEGYLTQLCLKELRANKVFMGARAANLSQGLMLDEVSEVTLFRDCAQAATEIILVADHSKFGQVATAVLGPLGMVHCIVTDSALPAEYLAKLRDLGFEVVLA